MFHKQNGNALLYVLIAVTLLAVLTYTIMGENRGQQQNQLTESRTKLLASDLISHANSAELAFKQMEMFGVEADQVLFDLPGTAGYNTNVTRQIYHPSGGGLSVFNDATIPFDTNGNRGWRFQNQNNVEWTPTTATDLMFTFLDLHHDVCAAINLQLHKSSTIPKMPNNGTFDDFNSIFYDTGINDDFLATTCTECENVKAMCIGKDQNSDDNFAFYNIIKYR